MVFQAGVSSLEAYRISPAMRSVRAHGDWVVVPWSLYDFGGPPRLTVDFYLHIGGQYQMRPATCKLDKKC